MPIKERFSGERELIQKCSTGLVCCRTEPDFWQRVRFLQTIMLRERQRPQRKRWGAPGFRRQIAVASDRKRWRELIAPAYVGRAPFAIGCPVCIVRVQGMKPVVSCAVVRIANVDGHRAGVWFVSWMRCTSRPFRPSSVTTP